MLNAVSSFSVVKTLSVLSSLLMSSIISVEAAATRLVSIFSDVFVSFGVKPSLIISNSVRLIAF